MNYQPGTPVRIHRPSKDLHNQLARFLSYGDNNLVWVSYGRGIAAKELPDERYYNSATKYHHKLLPASQLRPLEPTT